MTLPSFPLFLQMAFRNLFRQRSRTLLTMSSVALGVISLVLASGFVEDVLDQLREATIRSQLGHFQIFATDYLAKGQREPLAHMIDRPQGVAASVAALPGVVNVAQRLSLTGLLSNGRAELPVLGEAVEPEREARIGTAIKFIAGRGLQAGGARMPEAVIGEGVGAALKLSVGDIVTFTVATRDGAMNVLEFLVVGIFRSPFKDYDARAVRISLVDGKELLGTSSVHSIVGLLHDTAATESAISAARRSLPGTQYEIKPWWELAEFYQSTVELYKRQFLVLELIVFLMVVLGVANSMNMSLHERQAEFATVRAFGHRSNAVFRNILIEATVMGVVASAAGALIGCVLALVLSAMGIDMPPPPNSEAGYTAKIRLALPNLALAAGIGLAACVIAAFVPAWRLSRMPITDGLRHSI